MRRQIPRVIFMTSFYVALYLAACGGVTDPGGAGASAGSGGGGTSGATSVDAACDQLSETLCSKVLGCGSLYVELITNCVPAEKSLCLAITTANPVWTIDVVEGCTSAISTGDCSMVKGSALDACYGPPGNKAAGDPCLTNVECGDGLSCARQPGRTTSCGVCTKQAPAGAACGSGTPCEKGLLCDKTCYAPLKAGELCTDTSSCTTPLVCAGPGQPCHEPLPEGSSCNFLYDECDNYNELFCSPASNTCTKAVVAKTAGAPCGYDSASGGFTICGANLFCSGGNITTDTCIARTEAGQPCQVDSSGRDPCVAGLFCVGTCKSPTDVVCR